MEFNFPDLLILLMMLTVTTPGIPLLLPHTSHRSWSEKNDDERRGMPGVVNDARLDVNC